MVTSLHRWGVIGGISLAACSAGPETPTADPEAPTPARPLPPDTVEPGGRGPTYPGSGFRVHEWGTNTIVVGSDGSMQRGLQHEEEDLPAFVYDRKREELAVDATTVKMETPVTYFYSDKPLHAEVSVRFPQGILTQWYPAVRSFSPPFFKGKGDPALDVRYPFTNAQCRAELGKVQDGLLDWGDVEILAPGASTTLVDAPLDRFTWSHAREVGANAVRLRGPDARAQEERFLFYRGLGNFPIDVKIAASPAARDGGLSIQNQDRSHKVGAVFVLRVEKDRAGFEVVPAGIAPLGTLEKVAPEAAQPLDEYAQALAKAMVTELDAAGLYHDESVAMVKTWARQWFRTPGVRVLYLAPSAWTDAQIPLTIEPAPVELVRVMVIRVEAITVPQEEADVAAAAKLDSMLSKVEGEAHFASLGRFAEPRLRRAIAKMGTAPVGATALLDRIAGANVSSRAGE